MPSIKVVTALAANGIAFPLVGSQYEFLPFNARVEFSVLADPSQVVEANLASGTDILMQNAIIDEKAATAPVTYPEDYQVDDVVAAGERLGLSLRNTLGTAARVRTTVRITPI